jgi:toxin ParE1/3/4
MSRYILDPCVEDELWGIWHFITRNNPDAAARVIEAARETFKMLAANAGLGRRRRFRNPRLKDTRSWRISGFENHLIFYRAVADGIQVNHIYHGAQDIDALFEIWFSYLSAQTIRRQI